MSPQTRQSAALAAWCLSGATAYQPSAVGARSLGGSGASSVRSLSTGQRQRPETSRVVRTLHPRNPHLFQQGSRRVLQTQSFTYPTISCRKYLNQRPSILSLPLPKPLHLTPIRNRLGSLLLNMGQSRESTNGGHGHHHGHHHHHDNSFLVSANKNDPGVRITRIGLLSNLAMAIAKFIGGWTFGSKAMVADGWHSITDLASDILTLATVSWSIKPPTDRFPLGFGKVESLGALGVSGMLVVGGLYMGWESAISLYGHFNPEGAHQIFEHVGHGHSHSHSHSDMGIPSLHAAWLAAGTIAIKEWLYHATMKVAKERKSSVLASNAVHHRVDSLTGIVTLAAIVGANLVQNAAWLDPVGGLLISLMVIKAGTDNTQSALYELADQSIDDDVQNSVKKHAQRAMANVSEGHEAELRDVSGVKSGQNLLVDLEVGVPGAWTVEDLRDLEEALRAQVGAKVRGVKRVRVRFVSKDAPVNEKFDEFVQSTVDADPAHDSDEEPHDHTHKH